MARVRGPEDRHRQRIVGRAAGHDPSPGSRGRAGRGDRSADHVRRFAREADRRRPRRAPAPRRVAGTGFYGCKGDHVSERVEIRKLASGVPGLDDVLGGGIPELSFNLLVGGPGSGKTTLAQQIMFATASPERPALFVTILGEPPIKMLRYQQQFGFFEPEKLTSCVRYLHLGGELLADGLEKVLATIVREVEATSPKLVFIDSFRAVVRRARDAGQMELQNFVQRLSLHLTGWEATTFLIGEYEAPESDGNPIFTVADGILWLSQVTQRNSVVRKVQVVKMRGQGQLPGLHTMKVSSSGIRVYPRLPNPERVTSSIADRQIRRRVGIPVLDAMLGGGIPGGYSVLIVGPSGSGKTILSTQFIREGIARGETGVIAVFEKPPAEYLTTAPHADELGELVAKGKLKVLYLRPLDLSIDETMEEIATAVRAIGATRVAIDSLPGLELALAPSFREDFRESLYRMVGALVSLGVTVVMTAELVESYTELRLSPHGISFLTDGIILQRYVELEGALRRVACVVKMRGVDHQKELRLYEIGAEGIAMGEVLTSYAGILTGAPRRSDQPA
ncbi:MAG: AAA family ATPase [Myxococcales bacterium]|nr:AAA family ATPase [Myxococcales bacterium]